jgi:prevent-host-death family protein
MGAVGVRELKVHASDIVQRAEAGEAFLVTRRGKPVAVVLPFGVEAEDLILGHAPAFIKLREDARTELRKGLTVGWESLKRKANKTKSRD